MRFPGWHAVIVFTAAAAATALRTHSPTTPRQVYTQLSTDAAAGLDSIRAGMRNQKWTMMIGDSILYAEFMSVVKVLLKPDCDSGLRSELPRERAAPAGWYIGSPVEYDVVCTRNATRHCTLSHSRCLRMKPFTPCPGAATDPFCAGPYYPTCNETEFGAFVQRMTAADVEFAISYHWSPGPGLGRRDPDIGQMAGLLDNQTVEPGRLDPGAASGYDVDFLRERLQAARPSAIVLNNCLHSWPYSWALQDFPWQKRLRRFLGVLQHNLEVLSLAGFEGRIAYLACDPLSCTRAFAWNANSANCREMNAELRAVNVGSRRLFTKLGLSEAYIDTWQLSDSAPNISLDGVHPCWTRPCLWEKNATQPSALQLAQNPFWGDSTEVLCLAKATKTWKLLAGAGASSAPLLPPASKLSQVWLPDVSDLSPRSALAPAVKLAQPAPGVLHSH